MDPRRFDALIRTLGAAASRRATLAALAGTLVATLVPALDSAGKKQGAKNARNKERRRSRDRDRDGTSGRKQRQRAGKRRQTQHGRNADQGKQRSKGNTGQTAAKAGKACYGGSPCIPGPGKNLSKCNFQSSAALKSKNCKGCNLSKANLRKADARGATLTSANLGGVCAVDANLSGARLTSANTSGMILCRTTMPDGSINNSGCGKGTDCCQTCIEIGGVCGSNLGGGCCGGAECRNGRCACPETASRSCGGECRECCTNSHCASGLCCEGACCAGSETCRDGQCSHCQPNCEDKECGSDGCDGSCGDCPPSETCNAQHQCVCQPRCGGKDCGPDGCDGSCGDCPSGESCNAQGQCECVPECGGKICGSDSCDGLCEPGCQANASCNAGGTICTCDFVTCGSACCGQNQICCGSQCVTGVCCNDDGCQSGQAPDCIGNRCVCASNGNQVCPANRACCATGCANLENDAANCGACGNACRPGEICESGSCVCESGVLCEGEAVCCASDQVCAPETGTCCTPDCTDAVCGSDGCGGSCGACPASDPFCVDGQCFACQAAIDCLPVICEIATCAAGTCSYERVADGEQAPTCNEDGQYCCLGNCCTDAQVCTTTGCCSLAGSCPANFCGLVPDGCGGQMPCSCDEDLGLTCCGTACVDTISDADHCGACNDPCPQEEICQGSVCGVVCASSFCPASSTAPDCCGGECTDVQTDPDHCGACDEPCGLQQVCGGGECACPCPEIGCYLTRWGSSIGNPGSGNGQFNLPSGVAVAPSGTVYVADYHNHRVQYFQADGTYLGQWGSFGDGPGEFHSAISVAVSPDGQTVYAGDNALSNRVQRFTPDGTWQGEWGGFGTDGTGSGEFNHVVGLETAPSGSPRAGRVYAAGFYDSRVQFFDPDGTYRGMLGTGPGSGPGQLLQPNSIGVAPDGTVYVSEGNTHRISYFTADGVYLGQWGGLDFNRTPGKFIIPSGVAVAADGTVLVASRDNRVQLFTPTGGYLGEFGSAGSGSGQFIDSGDVALAPDDKTLYVVDATNNRVQAFCVTPPLP